MIKLDRLINAAGQSQREKSCPAGELDPKSKGVGPANLLDVRASSDAEHASPYGITGEVVGEGVPSGLAT